MTIDILQVRDVIRTCGVRIDAEITSDEATIIANAVIQNIVEQRARHDFLTSSEAAQDRLLHNGVGVPR